MNFLFEPGIPRNVSKNLLNKSNSNGFKSIKKKSRYITVITLVSALFIIFNPSVVSVISPIFNPIFNRVYGKDNYLQSNGYIVKPISSDQVALLTSSIDDPNVTSSSSLAYVIPGPEISSSKIENSTDPRYIAMYRFLKSNNSPMINHSQTFITYADKYHLDWRLVAAISGAESGFGRVIPLSMSGQLSYNGWGWTNGMGGFSSFASWDDAIEHITKGIATSYGTHITPSQMESTYCPPCTATNHWEQEVNEFMYEISPTK